MARLGALLRREGNYSSQLAMWRKQRAATEGTGLEPQKRGPKADPTLAEARHVVALTKENARLRRKLATAQTIIDGLKNVAPYHPLPLRHRLHDAGNRVHNGRTSARFQQRADMLNVAFLANPDRFKDRAPQSPRLPTAVWINPSKQETTSTNIPDSSTVFSCNLVSQSH